MDTDTTPRLTRRHLIRAGVLGLTTGLAGCNGETVRQPNNPETGGTATPPNGTDDEPDGGTHEMPETPPATFKGLSAEFSFFGLPVHEELTDPTDLTQFGKVSGMHPDNRVFDLEVRDANTAHLTISQVIVDRPFTLTLYVRDTSNNYKERTATIEATDDQYTTVTTTFDLSGINLPRMAGGFMELVAEDSHPGNPYTFLAKRHQYVAIPYKNGVEWMNSPALDSKTTTKDGAKVIETPRGVTINGKWHTRVAEPAGAIKTIDGDSERTVLMAVRTKVNGEVYGVSCHIDHDAYDRFNNGSASYQYDHNFNYECYYATDISHITELGSKTATAISRIGISAPHRRLQVLGDLVQMIPYVVQSPRKNLTTILYESSGNCSLKSYLLGGILQTDPWNQMNTYIDCEINGERHSVAGLDVRYLGNQFNRETAFTVSPTSEQIAKGYPDTEYAFYDMTYDSFIGERTDGVEGYHDHPIRILNKADFEYDGDQRSHTPPDY